MMAKKLSKAEEDSVPTFEFRTIGLGFLWASVVAAPAALAPLYGGLGYGGDSFPGWYAMMGALALSLAFFGISSFGRSWLCRRSMGLAAALIEAVSFLLLGLITFSGPTDNALVCSLAATAGFSAGILFLLWARVYAVMDRERMEVAVPACGLATLLSLLVIPTAQLPAWLFAAALPTLSGAMLLLCLKDLSFEGEGAVGSTRDGSPVASDADWSVLWRSAAVLFAAYLLIGFPRGGDAFIVQRNLSIVDYSSTLLASLVAIAIAIASVRYSVRLDVLASFRWFSAPLIVAALLLMANDPVALVVGDALNTVVDTVLYIVIFVYAAFDAAGRWQRAVLVVGALLCACNLGELAGSLLGSQTDSVRVLGVLAGLFACSMMLVGPVASASARQRFLPSRSAAASTSDSLSVAIQRVSVQYSLSEREREVLALLARGRSQPFIRDELVLSKNTVASHVKRIYAKLGVHSKQELIDLVERERLDCRC